VDVGRRGHRAGRGGEPERRASEAEGAVLDRLHAGVEHEVAAGDAGVDRARSDVDGDVARAQVEELDLVLGVDEHEFAAVPALAVAGLAQEVGGGAREGPLVRYSDPQHEFLYRWV